MSITSNIGIPIPVVNRNSDLLLYQNAGMSIGKRVKQARLEAGMTQKELAAKVGIKQPTLSDLENGESASTSSIATLAAVLGVSALWLQTGRGPKAIDSSIRPAPDLSVPDLAQLIAAFSRCNPEWKRRVMDLAELGAKESSGQAPE